jgi:hypothetical protein
LNRYPSKTCDIAANKNGGLAGRCPRDGRAWLRAVVDRPNVVELCGEPGQRLFPIGRPGDAPEFVEGGETRTRPSRSTVDPGIRGYPSDAGSYAGSRGSAAPPPTAPPATPPRLVATPPAAPAPAAAGPISVAGPPAGPDDGAGTVAPLATPGMSLSSSPAPARASEPLPGWPEPEPASRKSAGLGEASHAPSAVALLVRRPGLLDESGNLPAMVLPREAPLRVPGSGAISAALA